MYDAKRVIDRAHQVGALVLLDCYQSVTLLPEVVGANVTSTTKKLQGRLA